MIDLGTIDIAIIGGGAAGLTSAIFAAETAGAAKRVVIVDSALKLGAKILVSGGGRCNVTHHAVSAADFNGSRNVVRNILAAFGVVDTMKWFESMGVELTREETGKLFPAANTARAVVDALLRRCEQLNVELMTGCRVVNVQRPTDADPIFTITHVNGTLRAARVIFCTGGRSLPRTGSDGSGWRILQAMGHTVTPTYAALTPLVLAPQMFHAQLAGIALDVELTVFAASGRVDHRVGSLLWTHFGISGPVVMDASRHWLIAHETSQQPRLLCNLLPGETFETADQWLTQLTKARPKATIMTLLSERLPRRVMAEVLKHVGIDSATLAGQLPRDARRTLVHGLTALVLPVTQQRGWNYAEVTAGGVPLNEVDFRTMQSRTIPGLYLAGETLDCDGRIGGFNFQWAWATGYLAGRAAATAKS